jgi:acetolactate synthase-1/2/3 large subunit
VNYHEQASAFAACGYAQIATKPGVAYATSGPGATNLITGICNAYFDSIPTIFITGQVNTFETKDGMGVRQKGFQETNIIEMVQGVTKYCQYVQNSKDIKFCLEKAYHIACEGRPGPVLLDIPMNIQKSDIDIDKLEGFHPTNTEQNDTKEYCKQIIEALAASSRPCLLLGAGIKLSNSVDLINKFCEATKIPVVSSMIAFDVLPKSTVNNYGFIGAYGSRTGNFIISKSDLVIAMGTRLDVRQVGAKKEVFAPNAKLMRIDIDSGELSNKIKEDEMQIKCDIHLLLTDILESDLSIKIEDEWITKCNIIRDKLEGMDDRTPNKFIRRISKCIPDNRIITTDVGQNQVWVAQSFEVKQGQRVIFSGGHGAMGYSLPAAIGAYYASKNPVICMNGDGGLQMNIQELQFIARENLPITVIVFNNNALGMIRHFQEMYFESNYAQTVKSGGYEAPSFEKIAKAYELKYYRIMNENDITEAIFNEHGPLFVEIVLEESTYVFPKLEFGKPNQDQEPLIERELYKKLMEL